MKLYDAICQMRADALGSEYDPENRTAAMDQNEIFDLLHDSAMENGKTLWQKISDKYPDHYISIENFHQTGAYPLVKAILLELSTDLEMDELDMDQLILYLRQKDEQIKPNDIG